MIGAATGRDELLLVRYLLARTLSTDEQELVPTEVRLPRKNLERSMKSFQKRLNSGYFDLCIRNSSCIYVQVACLGSP